MDKKPTSGELWCVAIAAGVLALAAFFWSLKRGALLYYGDAEAHLHIARRIFDAQRPRLSQLGTVWLPLPHLLMLPFVNIDSLWRSGIAGAIPSTIEVVLCAVGFFKLARRWLSVGAATFALMILLTNPNLLYLGTTAMTEPLFLAILVWTLELLISWHDALYAHGARARQTLRLGWALSTLVVAAVFARYDGWILGFAVWAVMAWCLLHRKQILQLAFVAQSFLMLLAPIAWMVYNAIAFKDPLDFLRGPYSAQAIELRTAHGVIPPHPGWHNPWQSLLFYCKDAMLIVGNSFWGTLLFIVAALSLCIFLWLSFKRDIHTNFSRWILLLIWLPLPFYCYSIAYGSVPVFMPVWWPHSYYNTRYGVEILPALALFVGLAADAILTLLRKKAPRYIEPVVAALLLVAVANSWSLAKHDVVVYTEARENNEYRGGYEQAIAARLKLLHTMRPAAILLMETSSYPGIISRAEMHYQETINESDLDLYDAALKNPEQHATYAIGFSDDDVERAIKQSHKFEPVWKFEATNQPTATIYVSDSFLKSAVGNGVGQ